MADRDLCESVASLSPAASAKKSVLRRTLAYFKRNGAGETAKQIVFGLARLGVTGRYYALGRRFDETNNVKTSGRALLSELTVDGASTDESLWYEPAPVNVVHDVFRKLRKSYESFTFVDLGSGSGRVALQASHFNFHKVVGVEFAKELHLQATENLLRYPNHHRKCRNVEFLCVDVRAYNFPKTDLAVFIFDSFKADLLRCVIQKLKASYLANPRQIYLVYLNPDPRNEPIPIIEGSGFLQRVEPLSFIEQARFYHNSPYRVVAYETKLP